MLKATKVKLEMGEGGIYTKLRRAPAPGFYTLGEALAYTLQTINLPYHSQVLFTAI